MPDILFTYEDWEEVLRPYTHENYGDKQRYKVGQIPVELVDKLKSSLDKLPRLEFPGNTHNGFVYSGATGRNIKSMNEVFSFFDFKEPQLEVIKEICHYLREDIEEFLKSSFRVLNVRGFEGKKDGRGIGPNRMHCDGGFPYGTYKIILYLTEASVESGFTNLEVKNEDFGNMFGPPGTYILFNPVDIKHGGRSPGNKNLRKQLIEITLCSWEETIIEPISGGPNSRHPIHP